MTLEQPATDGLGDRFEGTGVERSALERTFICRRAGLEMPHRHRDGAAVGVAFALAQKQTRDLRFCLVITCSSRGVPAERGGRGNV